MRQYPNKKSVYLTALHAFTVAKAHEAIPDLEEQLLNCEDVDFRNSVENAIEELRKSQKEDKGGGKDLP